MDIDLDIDVDGEVVQIGRSYTLPAGKRVESAVVIAGTARIEGTIEQDLVVVAGAATLAGTARVGGDVVVVGGTGDVQPGAVVGGDLVAVGSGLKVPPGFSPGGDQVSVGAFELGDQFANAAPWFTRGLLWGRPIVPDLPWMWAVVVVIVLLYLLVNLVLEGPVRACMHTLGRKPLTTGLAGFLTLLLISPVSLILTLSVVGLALVPFLWFALLIAGLIGNVAAARWIGSRILPEESPHNRLQAARSLGIGLAAIILVGMVPVAGLTAWALVSLLGLGAAATALVTGLRRENPPSPAPTPPPAAESGSDTSTGGAAEPSSRDTAPAASPPEGENPFILSAGHFSPPAGSPAARPLPGDGNHRGILRDTPGQILCPAAGLSRGALELEGDHRGRHHLWSAGGSDGWESPRLYRCAGEGTGQHPVGGGRGTGLALDPLGPRATGLARQDRQNRGGAGPGRLAAIAGRISPYDSTISQEYLGFRGAGVAHSEDTSFSRPVEQS